MGALFFGVKAKKIPRAHRARGISYLSRSVSFIQQLSLVFSLRPSR